MTRREINTFANKVCDNEKSFNEVVRVCTEYEKQIEKAKKIIKEFMRITEMVEGFEPDYTELIAKAEAFFGKVRNSSRGAFPFTLNGSDGDYRFFYYDPNYECKRAYAEGKQIQHVSYSNDWIDCKGEPDWENESNFRIKPEEPKSRQQKPEKKYRKFKDTDELIKTWEEKMNKFLGINESFVDTDLCPPSIWVRTKHNKSTCLITRFDYRSVFVDDEHHDMADLFNNFEFLDGTPCGVEE